METQRGDNGTDNAARPAITLPTSVAPETLSSSQLHALFDILTHRETYAEVESFKDSRTISEYGYPFARHDPQSDGVPSYASDSAAPLLAGVLRSIVLPCPGVRDLPTEFWHVRFQGILEKLAEAELSESYDKAALGIRKTLATAASAIHEAVSRGLLGGAERRRGGNLHREYDRSNAQDLVQAWEDALEELVYGDLVDELFSCAAEKPSLEEHSPGVQAAADYVIIHLATLMHQVFVSSPEGPYLLKLLENVHKLFPYSLVKQTLRIGNAATMLNGMMRLLLAKMGVGALSNWVGLTQNANDGMNLLQRIIWLVLSWDASEFRKVSEAIERSKGGPVASKEQLATIRSYVSSPREEHDEARRISAQEARPMVAVILERSSPGLSASVSEAQLVECSQYLSALLSARDRDEISNTLCRQNPDLFTQAIKDAVAAFEPMVRAIHQRVDLREQISAAEGFVNDFLSIHKPKKSTSGLQGFSLNGDLQDQQAPSVEDYVLLLRNNRQLLYNWLHQLASQCPELRDDFCAWAKKTIKEFRQAQYPPPKPADAITPNNQKPELPPDTKQRPGAAGALSADLQDLFASLAPETRAGILPAIDAHAAYLSALEDLSLARMQRILDNLATSTTTNGATTPSPTTTTAATPSAAAAPAQASQTAQTAPPSFFSPAYWSGRSTPRSPTPNPDAVPPARIHNKAGGRSVSGPGMYLSRWQHLLDSTAITPAYPGGAVRRGRDVKGQVARGKVAAAAGVAGAGTAAGQGGWDAALLARMGQQEEEEAGAAPPDVGCVVEALGERFRGLVKGLVNARWGRVPS